MAEALADRWIPERRRWRPLALTLTQRDEKMMMKLVVYRTSDKVLGCHIFGPNAGDMVQLVAMRR